MFEFLGRHVRGMLLVSSLCLASLALHPQSARAEFIVPPLSSPVVDGATVLNPSAASEIENVLRKIRETGGPQINVLTVPSLDGLPIETASIKVTDAWKLGGQKTDDGVLFLISMGDRKMRIEVGQGLEGVLTDADAKRIIEDRVLPYFRAGRAGDGIVVGVRSILEKTAPEALKSLGEAPARARGAKDKRRGGGLPFPVLVILFLFIMFAGGRRGRRSGLMGALAGAALGSSGRGGWSGRGGSGGGWSGGGGGFSGGGASGSW